MGCLLYVVFIKFYYTLCFHEYSFCDNICLFICCCYLLSYSLNFMILLFLLKPVLHWIWWDCKQVYFLNIKNNLYNYPNFAIASLWCQYDIDHKYFISHCSQCGRDLKYMIHVLNLIVGDDLFFLATCDFSVVCPLATIKVNYT